MPFKFLPLVLWAFVAGNLGAAQPPVHDTLNVTVCVLNAVSLEPRGVTVAARALKIDRKSLPKSAQPFLRPSGLMDAGRAPVVSAARKAVKRLGAAGAKDGGKVFAAVLAWLNARPRAQDAPRPAAMDWRTGWAKASVLAGQPSLDGVERTRLGVAMLRSLGVPARPCLVDGQPRIQAFMQYAKAKPGKKRGKKTGPSIKGFWAIEGGLEPGQALDGWALDSGELARVEWQPQQELAVARLGGDQAFFATGDEAAARAAFAHLTRTGSLPKDASRTPPQSGAWLTVSAQWWTLRADGALQAANYLAFMVPYLPHQADWAAEEEPPQRQDTLACGLFSDRPTRLTVPTAWVDGDWNRSRERSVQGAVHMLPCRVRRPGVLVQAERTPLGVADGRVLRADNLAPMANVSVTVEALGDTQVGSVVAQTDAQGKFSVALPASQAAWAFRLNAGAESKTDAQLFLRQK